VEQTKGLAAKGVKELILIAQDLTYYGLDIYKKRALADLLRQLSDVDGIEWIRLHYAFPAGFPEDVLDVMKERKNICNYIDIPLQHASTNMLKAMRRGITREKTYDLIKKFRERVPGIAIRTTLIAGYPGETEADFEEMKEWVQEVKFDRLGIFTYSHEENTHAYDFEDDVPEEVKKSRADEVMEIQSGISAELNHQKVGKVYKVLFDRVEGGYYVGRSEHDSPEVDNEILVKKTDDIHVAVGTFHEVRITETTAYDLYGELTGN
jgi:ribosomal protein S12 methylthiotransferase